MKYYNTLLFVITLFGVLVTNSAQARQLEYNADGQTCTMVENVQIGVNFSNIPTDIKASKSFVEQKAGEIFAIAGDLGIEDITIQNMNYNIYSNKNSGGCNVSIPSDYRLNGNISFKLGNSERAENLMERLSEKGYNVNFNMNAYRQCQ